MSVKVVVGQGVITPNAIPTERHFPNFLRAYSEFTENQEASERIHMWTGIATIAAALERKVWLRRSHYTTFPNLYTLIVGAAGLIHKSTSTAIGIDLLRDIPTMKIMADRLTDASLVEALSRSSDKFIDGPNEVRHSSVLCYASEFSVLMKETFGIVAELLTTFYDCIPHDSSKPWIKETRGEGQIKVYGPCFNMLACTTPTALKDCIPTNQMEAGLASRIIYVVENKPPTKFIAIPEYDPKTAEMRKKLVSDLMMIHDIRGEMRMTEEAKEYYRPWYEKHKMYIYEHQGDTRFAGYFGRKPTHIEKLAMILSCNETNDRIIQVQHVEMAVALLNALEESMMTVIEPSGKNENASTLMKLDIYIAQRKKVSDTHLRRDFIFDADTLTLTSLLQQLQVLGQIRQLSHGNAIQYEAVEGAQPLGAWRFDQSQESQELPL